jgi:hypothetical protein
LSSNAFLGHLIVIAPQEHTSSKRWKTLGAHNKKVQKITKNAQQAGAKEH